MMQITSVLTTDLSGITRGRAFPAKDRLNFLSHGIGWVPANQALTAFDDIADNPWGSHGDLRILPDGSTETEIQLLPDTPRLHYLFGDITDLSGQPWSCCPRSFLKQALADLKALTGLELIAAFEHEFVLQGVEPNHSPSFSLQALRAIEPFPQHFMSALSEAGQEPEMFLPEYAPNQFEVTCRPTDGLAAADRAVTTRLIARDLAAQLGFACTFAPKLHADSVGNGVHIHYSLRDKDGRPATYDRDGPAGMSKICSQFAAGIVAHMSALCAITAPGVISYLRLQPHHWSSAYTCLGRHNREATLRICPVSAAAHNDIADKYNLEFRAVDALSNPYLALGAMIRAGIDGIEKSMPCPALVDNDPLEYSADELESMNVTRLPDNLSAALTALHRDETARNWFSDELYACYTAVKNKEISSVSDLAVEDMIKRYLAVY